MASPSAPAAMPSVEDVARALCKAQHYDPDFDYDPHGIYDRPGSNVRWKLYQGQARAVLDLFAPILAEKERTALRRETRALSQAQEWRNIAEKSEARALAAEAALAAERERCAKIAESWDVDGDAPGNGHWEWATCETARDIAAAIRAQGE